MVDLKPIFKHNLTHKLQVKHMNTVQVKHVNVIPLFHLFQHNMNAAPDWQPAESTRTVCELCQSLKWAIIIENVGDHYSTTDI